MNNAVADPTDPPVEPTAETEPHYLGHRKRLREKLLSQGGDAMADYELLELLLMLAIPRRDVKPLAKTLLKRHGGFAEVIAAEAALLSRERGISDTGVAALKIVQAAAIRLLKDRVRSRPLINSWEHLLDYCVAAMAHDRNEQFRVLFLDARSQLIADEVQNRGTIDHTPVYPREVIRRALELGAASLILVHNHPSGDPAPSQNDIEMTRAVRDAARTVGVTIHDHVIVGRTGYVSFKSKGLL
ncbi:MAG: RadC family protein [Alphaproteobacteria bacterium]